MAKVTTYQRLDQQALHALLTGPQRGVAQDLLRRGLRVESQAKRNVSGLGGTGPKRVDSGRLRASITTVLVSRSGKPAVIVGTNVKYAIFVHDGTGLYGPRKHRIYPVRAAVLRFRPRGGKVVYARWTRGMKPNPFLSKALPAAKR